MRELSIFVDESGDFGPYAKHSPYYVLTMVFHNQESDISHQIKILNDALKIRGYENIAVHTEPLIRREVPYQNVGPDERRALFSKLYYFVLHSDILFKSFIYEKRQFSGDMKLEARMAKEFSFLLRDHLEYFQSFDKVIIYYDNGQREITKTLNAVLATELTNYEMRRVSPVDYRLFQAADLLCTLAILRKRYESNRLTRSDILLFHSKSDLRKDFLKRIVNKEFPD